MIYADVGSWHGVEWVARSSLKAMEDVSFACMIHPYLRTCECFTVTSTLIQLVGDHHDCLSCWCESSSRIIISLLWILTASVFISVDGYYIHLPLSST